MRFRMILAPNNFNGLLDGGTAGFTGNAFVGWRAVDGAMVVHCEHTTRVVMRMVEVADDKGNPALDEDGNPVLDETPSYEAEPCGLVITEAGASCAVCGLYLQGVTEAGEVVPNSTELDYERELTRLRVNE